MKINHMLRAFLFVLCSYPCLVLGQRSDALGRQINYDESKIPAYTLPDPLVMENGKRVTSVKDWEKKRRPEILRLFETQVYGKSPQRPKLRYKLMTEDKQALNGIATRKEVAVYFSPDNDLFMTVLLYIPNQRKGAVPLFFGLNFKGNQSVSLDPGITYSESRTPGNDRRPEGSPSRTPGRGAEASRWPIELLMERGYGVATVYRGDIDPDYDDGFQNGVHALFYAKGQTQPKADEWGTLAAWAWGLSCAMDYFEVDKDINATQVAVVGHSRHGKTALWAGAIDQRFALTISNDSGCGGAALSRRGIGETAFLINKQFPHWFCANFKQYNDKEDELPVDQHELIALMAPRPVYIASAKGDTWADPKGEFLSGLYANPVYELYGKTGLPVSEMPAVDEPVLSGTIGYHIRTGEHDIKEYDWRQFMEFADRVFKIKN